MDHPDRFIERVVVDHKARVGGVLEHFDKFAERNVLLHRYDVGTRHHEIIKAPFVQAEDVLEHPAFVGRKTGLGGCAVKQNLKV